MGKRPAKRWAGSPHAGSLPGSAQQEEDRGAGVWRKVFMCAISGISSTIPAVSSVMHQSEAEQAGAAAQEEIPPSPLPPLHTSQPQGTPHSVRACVSFLLLWGQR